MFTGIITHQGKIVKKTPTSMEIESEKDLIAKLEIGSSIANDGVCLTVVEKSPESYKIEYVPETLKRTNLGEKKEGDLLNLELAATYATYLDGHIVQGHVDLAAKCSKIEQIGNSFELTFEIPESSSHLVVEKGSICINGISLTVAECGKNFVKVAIIPHTWEVTNLHSLKEGSLANIEFDILGKYLQKLISKQN